MQKARKTSVYLKRAAIALCIILPFAGILLLPPPEAPRDERIYATVDSLQHELAEHQRRADSIQWRIDTLRAEMTLIDSKLQRWLWRESLPALAIEEGKRKLTQASRWNLDTLNTFEQCDSFYQAALHPLALVYREHIRQLPLEISDWDMENIKDELTQHYNVCLLPLYNKARNLGTKESDLKGHRDNDLREATCEKGKKYFFPTPAQTLIYIVMDDFLYREKNSVPQQF